MARSLQNKTGFNRLGDNDGSDYGSDFSAGEEELVDRLLVELESKVPATDTATGSSSSAMAAINATRNHVEPSYASLANTAPASISPTGLALSNRLSRRVSPFNQVANTPRESPRAMLLGPVEYPDLSRALSDLTRSAQGESGPLHTVKQDADSHPPLQRFRSKRPLTVTDLATGAWCELQHWYTLTLLPGGKKTKTSAMKGGSRVHRKLEDEVHYTVQVHIATKEEAFALRLWNIIQGLRTLRDNGLTRELEVWGKVEGEVLNGVIDQLTHESPDASFEEELNLTSSNGCSSFPTTQYQVPNHKMAYLTDVKTRGSDRLPTGTALRPARVQLFLYHRLLSDMAADKLDYSDIFNRYGLHPDARFSDAFMAQLGELHDEIFYDADSQVEESSIEAHPPDLIKYRSISQIIPLLKAELKETFPCGAASIGNLLAVQYRHRNDGHIIGLNSFRNDPDVLNAYVKESLLWWRGERKPNGVSLTESYKCGWCEFAGTCQWRKDKEAEFLRNKTNATRVLSTP
ncbi:hypothetical protein GGS21DRAFT_338283 [Xylaria nigripes]|nr:hypothetical protein GGS21DRAFT_338283 [Xylaria nigripes]